MVLAGRGLFRGRAAGNGVRPRGGVPGSLVVPRRRDAAATTQDPLPGPSVEHGLDVLPGVDHLIRGRAAELDVAPPRVEVGRVRLDVLGVRQPVRVEDELVRREEESAEGALDALRAGAVVARGDEGAPAAPGAVVHHLEGEVVR